VDDAFLKVFHSGKYSALSFHQGLNIYEKIEEAKARGREKAEGECENSVYYLHR
jgi:hypothetical protein